jgi:hypothetical protein
MLASPRPSPLASTATVLRLVLLLIANKALGAEAGAEELKRLASQEFVAGHFAQAAAHCEELARRYPPAPERRYAVQMLGTLYEEKLVDVGKAIFWSRRFLEEYAEARQADFYRRKLATLEALRGQEATFARWQALRISDPPDEILAREAEALLGAQPDFVLRADVLRTLAQAHVRLDHRRAAHEAYEALSRTPGGLTESDLPAREKAAHNWRLSSVWAGAAWAMVAGLLAAAVAGRPRATLTRTDLGRLAPWVAAWLVFSVLRLPSYFAAAADENPFPPSAVYLAALLELAILAWLFLFVKGGFWRTRSRALLLSAPALTLLLTAAVYYLFLVYQPKGPDIIDSFGVEYAHWAERWRSRG